MSTPIRITLSRAKGWRMPANTVKACRPGMWGNPFQVRTAAMAVAAYERWLGSADWHAWMWSHHRRHLLSADIRRLNPSDQWLGLIATLRGKNLACWCKPGTPCHADHLLQLANA